MAEAPCTISLLGLGKMGHRMAACLLSAFGELTVWNRTPGRADELVARGAVVAATPKDAARDAVLTVFTDLAGVETVLRGDNGLLVGWAQRGITDPVLVVHGTVSPVAVAELSEELASLGVRLLDAPVSGGTVGAERASLSIMVGGDRSAAEQLLPVFSAMGSTVRYLGPSGSGQLGKACNQIVVAATVTALSESVLLARHAGLDVATVLELLGGGLAGSELLRQKGDKWLREDFTAGGSAVNQLKDLRFAIDAALAAGLRLPVTETVTALFAELVAAGDGELDHTGIYRAIERLAGKG